MYGVRSEIALSGAKCCFRQTSEYKINYTEIIRQVFLEIKFQCDFYETHKFLFIIYQAQLSFMAFYNASNSVGGFNQLLNGLTLFFSSG